MRRLIVALFVALLSTLPLAAEVRTFDIRQPSVTTQSGISEEFLAHAEFRQSGLHYEVRHGLQTASFDFDGSLLRLDDGYVLEHRTISLTPVEAVYQLTASGPHGTATAVATIYCSRATGTVRADGVEALQQLMRNSRSLSILHDTLSFSRIPRSAPAALDLWPTACDFAQFQLAMASVAVTVACAPGAELSVPCAAAVVAYAAAAIQADLACNGPDGHGLLLQ